MIQGTETGEKVVLKNYYGEWLPVRGAATGTQGAVLRGGPLDGTPLADLAEGTLVYVDTTGTAEAATAATETVTEDAASDGNTETQATTESGQTAAGVDLDAFPEFEGIKYFRPAEFFCKCSDPNCTGKGSIHMSHLLLTVADRIRERYGPVTVTSGIRCRAHNTAVGGVAKSRHLDGRAMDFVISGVGAGTTSAWAKAQSEIRYTYAITATATHMDVE